LFVATTKPTVVRFFFEASKIDLQESRICLAMTEDKLQVIEENGQIRIRLHINTSQFPFEYSILGLTALAAPTNPSDVPYRAIIELLEDAACVLRIFP
jgi:hypothetical protein